jgi:hypothetical protein
LSQTPTDAPLLSNPLTPSSPLWHPTPLPLRPVSTPRPALADSGVSGRPAPATPEAARWPRPLSGGLLLKILGVALEQHRSGAQPWLGGLPTALPQLLLTYRTGRNPAPNPRGLDSGQSPSRHPPLASIPSTSTLPLSSILLKSRRPTVQRAAARAQRPSAHHLACVPDQCPLYAPCTPLFGSLG